MRRTREPNAPPEKEPDGFFFNVFLSAEFKFWFEKLTFAISKQRLTLAGQENGSAWLICTREAF